MEKRIQPKAKKTIPIPKIAFADRRDTVFSWLGNAGLFLNSRGTCIMVDPLLNDYPLPMLIEFPVSPEEIPHLDGIFITHSDDDHYYLPTLRKLCGVCPEYHSTEYVAQLMNQEGFPAHGHQIGSRFQIGEIQITLTPADHCWQNDGAFGSFERVFQPEDCCGFQIDTLDGSIWVVGDSRLMDAHLHRKAPDVILFDFSDDPWHIGSENAVVLANAYPEALLLLSHWGSVDAPDRLPFNADPAVLEGKIKHPGRILNCAPGQMIRFPGK